MRSHQQMHTYAWLCRDSHRCSPASRVRRVIVSDRMGVEQFTRIKSAVANLLQPYRQILVIQTLAQKLGIAACIFVSICIIAM